MAQARTHPLLSLQCCIGEKTRRRPITNKLQEQEQEQHQEHQQEQEYMCVGGCEWWVRGGGIYITILACMGFNTTKATHNTE